MAVLRLILLLLILCTCGPALMAQGAASCTGTITGRVMDAHDAEDMSFAAIYMLESERGIEADQSGAFRIEGVCPGELTLRVSHIGCDPEEVRLDFRGDTSLVVYLHHHDNYTQTVTVTSTAAQASYEERLDAQSDQQLSEVLAGITGVSTLRTGTAAAKPVYDGLFGNRLSIQNNGVAQSGQQWGNDHAPEIDPWVAAYVRVVEGVDALRYGGSTLGPTVLIEPADLTSRTGPEGKVAYGLRSNGLAHTLNARITDSTFVTYRLSATLKAAGDQRAPDYFLTNTGRREGNVALQVAKFFSPQWTANAYYSLFNAEVGVLRGSHIGNLSDLQDAIGRAQPYFTDSSFSYGIASPRQTVSHHLIKGELKYTPTEGQRLLLRYGGQLDDRKEYDVRRGDDDRAALQLLQLTHFLEANYHLDFGDQQHLEGGLQYEHVSNENQPGTGILPLIPDYSGQRGSAYATYHREVATLRYHFGARYDRQSYRAVRISRDLPRRIVRSQHTYDALGGAAGAGLKVNARLSTDVELTYRQRAPQINELYSQGLHQGVSGIEEGDSTLVPEASLKLNAGLHYGSANGKWTVSGSGFVQRVANFINLEPQAEFRLTLRGAFPLFQYRGVDATLWGGKVNMLTQWGRVDLSTQLAYVRGRNRTDELPLIYLPPLNWRTTVGVPVGEWRMTATTLLVTRQGNLREQQDFLPPPPGYTLVDVQASRSIGIGRRSLLLTLEAENILDTSYRDYLDRQRYFADAPGRSLNIRASYAW
ncbi:carboxypeptidase-like regulatory domain-containing protein [Neolewinella maritima]|uniref:carboxypeptidase-like regulatory domain-containing protein n=1 Tax=Neolewinella maritima TaxID=1383882 RepID=UPI001EE8C593|nr:carboxypeptidase-like regulatory domain-containing protein [Neolewinella maritima]